MSSGSSPGDAESLARLRCAFEDNFALGLECGAALCVWKDGVERLHLFGGFRDAARRESWTAETAVLVWSATKGPASACLLHALDRAAIPIDTRVAELWPEFAAAGKSRIRVSELLSHRAGLAAVADRSLPALDHEAVAACLASQPPAWEPGTAHGYGPRAFGYLLEELIRRVAGMTCGEYWTEHFGRPWDLDFWIGMPEAEHGRVAAALAPRSTAAAGEKTPFSREMARPGSLTHAAFSAPGGITGPSAMNSATMRSACLPAFGGIGTARALAAFYGRLARGEGFPAATAERFVKRLSSGEDLVLCRRTAFSTGFMLDPLEENGKVREMFGPSPEAFGHPGAGGSLAFADPVHRIGFCYVMNQMEPGAMPRERTRKLVRALYVE